MRLEDPDLLRGRATFLDDLPPPSAYAVFVRSPMAAARIVSIDRSDAVAQPGVLGVFDAHDLELGPLRAHSMLPEAFDRPPLAVGEVRFVGEAVAVVVALTRAQAVDAAALVDVRYDVRRWASDAVAAMTDVTPFLAGTDGNVAFEHHVGVIVELEAPPSDSTNRIVSNRSVNQRIAPVPMEPDGAQASPSANGHGLDIWSSTQRVHHVRAAVATSLGMELGRVQVRAPNVGGAFGGKFEPSPETVVVAAVARRLGRSVRWVQTRTENLQCMPHGRAQVQHAQLAIADDGRFRSLTVDVVNDAGAFAMVGAVIPMATILLSPGSYDIASVTGRGRSACTNRTPLGAYRGAGRPEATAMVERLIDIAAHDMGIDPVELRRRNLIGRDAYPFTSATGRTYDSGDCCALLDDVVARLEYDAVRAEQADRRRAGVTTLLGAGVAMWLDCTPMNRPGEHASVEIVADDGSPAGVRVIVRDGANDQGQAHRTTWASLVAGATGLPSESVELGLGDTDLVPTGEGTGSARSAMLAGGAVAEAVDAVVDQARAVAAHLLEAAPDDIVVGTKGFSVAGSPARTISWAAVARAASGHTMLPGDVVAVLEQQRGSLHAVGLGAAVDFEQPGPTYPNGCNGAVVEVDTETGAVRLVRFVAVDDCGTVLVPAVVEGQQHGGIAQGIGQALFEEFVDDADGNPLTSTLVEYAIPTAGDLPSFDVSVRPSPSPVNPLGVKGIGQGGAIGSTVAVQNAVVDALAHLGVRHIDLPLTPERVWRALQDAAADSGSAHSS